MYEEGTFVNKAALLKDTTGALFGLGANGVPDEALQVLGKYNQYWWKQRINGNGYQKVETTGQTLQSKGGTTFYYSDSIIINQSNGDVSLDSPISTGALGTTSSSAQTLIGFVRGKYCKNQTDAAIYYVPSTATATTGSSGGGTVLIINGATAITSQYVTDIGDWQYIQSSNRNAYPDSGIVNNVEYEFLGRPLENAVAPGKAEFGSYIGSGNYGSTAKNKLEFGINAKMLFVWPSNISALGQDGYSILIAPYGDPSVVVHGVSSLMTSSREIYLIWGEKSVEWYTEVKTAAAQFNHAIKYYYLAIG